MNKTNLELITLLTSAINMQNQELINIYSCELAKRLYVPESGISIEELMEGFGYRSIKKIDDKQISIEEYMRSRKNE